MSTPESYLWDWNAPREAVDPETFGRSLPHDSQLDRTIALFRQEEETAERLRREKTPPAPRLQKVDQAISRDEERERTLRRTANDRIAARTDKENAPLTQLYALPAYLRDPLLARLRFLRKKQARAEQSGKAERPATRWIHGKLTRILQRLTRTDERFLTFGYQRVVVRERLDALLNLPQLSKREVQTAATLCAGAFEGEYVRQCESYGEDITPYDALDTYQKLAAMAFMLHTTPHAWESLRTDTDRRTAPDIEKLPGALSRLMCADWWNRKLWRLRRIWREEQLRAACLVSCKTSSYLSKDALTEFREQRRRMREFLRSHELENEDGFTIDLETAYYSGNSNPKHRRFEMMANCKGMQFIAESRGDEAVFLTITAPSRYHATNEDGNPNPKWDGSTIRDSSNYLVNVFFAAVRKKLNRAGLRWYGVRVTEPHHDGTAHWHMMIFVCPEDREAIVNIVRDIAIREDRAELGNDITPRFKSELITADKGSPTAYIALYIGKSLDGDAVKGNDPKTGKPRTDNESGRPLSESAERAIGWAGLHGVQQFRFFGVPSRQVWRELRRLAMQMERNPDGPQRLKDPAMDNVLAAADAGCFASYIEKQGGVLIPRKDYVIRTAYDLADEPNDYGELGTQIFGIWSPAAGEDSRICTHPDNWKLLRKKAEPTDPVTSQAVDFDVKGGTAAPWTRGNNCPPAQKTDSETPESTPENIDIGPLDLRQLSPKERRIIIRRIREELTTKLVRKSSPFSDENPAITEALRSLARLRGWDENGLLQWSRFLAAGGEILMHGKRYRADSEGRIFSRKEEEPTASDEDKAKSIINRFNRIRTNKPMRQPS